MCKPLFAPEAPKKNAPANGPLAVHRQPDTHDAVAQYDPKDVSKITRNSHIVSIEVIEVKRESPAARSADGKIKLTAHSGTWAMEFTNSTTNRSSMISEGGEKMDTSGWNSGIRIKAINAKEPDPIQRKDLINFLASETFPARYIGRPPLQ